MDKAATDTVKGAGSVGGMIVLQWVQAAWVNDFVTLITTIGIVAGSILAIHGVYELFRTYYKAYKMRKNNE